MFTKLLCLFVNKIVYRHIESFGFGFVFGKWEIRSILLGNDDAHLYVTTFSHLVLCNIIYYGIPPGVEKLA